MTNIRVAAKGLDHAGTFEDVLPPTAALSLGGNRPPGLSKVASCAIAVGVTAHFLGQQLLSVRDASKTTDPFFTEVPRLGDRPVNRHRVATSSGMFLFPVIFGTATYFACRPPASPGPSGGGGDTKTVPAEESPKPAPPAPPKEEASQPQPLPQSDKPLPAPVPVAPPVEQAVVVTALLVVAAAAFALADGPLPFGDAIAVSLLGMATW